MSGNLQYPYGNTQTILLPGTSLSVTLTNENFESKTGNRSKLLDWLGYERRWDDRYELGTERTLYGFPRWRGPQFKESLIFEWRLMGLTEAQRNDLEDIVALQRQNKDQSRLQDGRLADRDISPGRTRGRLAPATNPNPNPGLEYFFPLYNFELIIPPNALVPQGQSIKTGQIAYRGTILGRETSLVPVSEDVA